MRFSSTSDLLVSVSVLFRLRKNPSMERRKKRLRVRKSLPTMTLRRTTRLKRPKAAPKRQRPRLLR